jgi:uncharacterized protein YbjT (DUF2867 family)
MKLAVFGATGKTGLEVLRLALDNGHMVTAFARHAPRLGYDHPRLNVVLGNALDTHAVDTGVKGQDAVICVLGTFRFRPGTEVSEGTLNIITAMKRHRVQRLICVTALGTGPTKGKIHSLSYRLFRAAVSDGVWIEKERQEEYVQSSGLDWTIVRPGRLVDKRDDFLQVLREGDDLPSRLVTERRDMATFLLKSAQDRAYIRQAVALIN